MAGLNRMAHSAVTSKPLPLEFRSGARTQLRSYLVSSGPFGSQDLESPPVELHCSLITPPARFLREIVLAEYLSNRFCSGCLIWLAVVLMSELRAVRRTQPSGTLRGFQKLIIFTDGWISVRG